jgi:transcriptional regulator with XRE-family HTH domain
LGIGKRIKEAREELGLTQKELAEIVGVTASAIKNYETEISHPKEHILYNLIKALHVDANYLFQDELVGIEIKKDPVFTESLDKKHSKAIDIFYKLSIEKQDIARDYLQYLLDQQDKGEKK